MWDEKHWSKVPIWTYNSKIKLDGTYNNCAFSSREIGIYSLIAFFFYIYIYKPMLVINQISIRDWIWDFLHETPLTFF